MTTTSARLLLWSPRVLGIVVCLFLSLFAVDAFSGGKTLIAALPDFAIHLGPALLLLIIVSASWWWEWVGGVTFMALGVAYMWIADGRLDWMLLISAPLVLVGMLFLWSWRYRQTVRGQLRARREEDR